MRTRNQIDLVLSNVLYQNDLLTSTTRMNLSLKRILSQSEMAYGDAVNIDSLLAILRSIKDSHEYVESIYLYTDGAARYFSSDKGIHTIDESTDSSWLDVYREIAKDSSSYIAPREISLGADRSGGSCFEHLQTPSFTEGMYCGKH